MEILKRSNFQVGDVVVLEGGSGGPRVSVVERVTKRYAFAFNMKFHRDGGSEDAMYPRYCIYVPSDEMLAQIRKNIKRRKLVSALCSFDYSRLPDESLDAIAGIVGNFLKNES